MANNLILAISSGFKLNSNLKLSIKPVNFPFTFTYSLHILLESVNYCNTLQYIENVLFSIILDCCKTGWNAEKFGKCSWLLFLSLYTDLEVHTKALNKAM